jgi:ABC-2 type transport system ATP-binding protein
LGTPDSLKEEIGGDVITIASKEPEKLSGLLKQKFGITPTVLGGRVRIEKEQGHAFIAQVVEAFSGMIDSLSLSKPTLEDVFIARTGHRFWEEE